MKIGIISDSHDHIENIRKCVLIFREKKVEFVLHLGDYVNPASVKAFQGIKLVGIFGNNDGDKFRLINMFNEINGEIKGDFHEFETDGLRFACYHGTEPQLRNSLIECGKYDVIAYGHTHECVNKKSRNTLVLNPGTSHGFWNQATAMIFDTKTKMAEIVNL
ncbi:MAG: metallophosphoesterase [Nitrospirae bacterium]|nr:metallophosphoesterase [Nitrospirota bacterium]MBI4838276.1 metallophosphoesterase [Nitrospirota bacterium]